MENKNRRFGQMLAIIEAISALTALEYMIKEYSAILAISLAGFLIVAVLDLVFSKVLDEGRKGNTILIVIRIVEFILLSSYIVYNDSGIRELEVITYVLMLLRMLEMIFLFDYSDRYTRTIIIGLMIFPVTVFVLIKLLLLDKSANYGENAVDALGSIAELAAVVFAVSFLSGIFISWLLKFERKVMEQRRTAEKTAEMNETLKLHQEKIKKANEELGIQRIKMESANRQIQRSNAEIKTQNEILKSVTTCFDIKSLADTIPEALCDSMENLLFCSVLLAPDSKRGNLIYNARANNISGEFLKRFSSEVIDRGLKDKDKTDIIIQKKMDAPCFQGLTPEDNLAVLAIIPLTDEDGLQGLIFCGSNIQNNFDDNDKLLRNIAAEIKLGINNIRLYNTVKEMAVKDGLTGIFNRRSLNEQLAQMGSNAEKDMSPLSVALFDIDHFKGFNDTYGHACGDVVLRNLAGILDDIAEKYSGIAARYGGEEFVLAFPGVGKEDCEAILQETKELIDSCVVDYEGQKLSVHVSIGYSSFPEIRNSANLLLGRADAAMYFAKEHGRNRIKCDGPDVDEFESTRK